MKKLISVLLLLAMVLGLFAGCGKEKETASDLHNAVEYLTSMYQTAGKDEAILISADLDVLSSVVVDGISYAIEWSVAITEGDADSVTVAESTKENHVKLDIPLRADNDILFTATATVSDAEGNTEAATFDYMVKGAGMTMEELVEAAYALDEDQAMEEPGVLIGVVTMINTPYDEGYQNLTCTIVVEDMTDRPIKCYRLKGVGADNVAVGDTIAVSGILKNYKGNVQFDAGCVLVELIKSDLPAVEAPADPMQIIQDAYALEAGTSLSYEATLTGTVTSVDTPYDAGYQNVTVTIAVTGAEDKPIKCYRLKGEGADRLAEGTVITVTGILMNYNGTVEFAQGCTLDEILSGDVAVTPTDQLAIVDEAYALATDAALPYTATLTGKITSIDTAYDTTYQNVTVTIVVTEREQKPIQCYRMKGTGADTLLVGDTITVTGTIKNYGGKIQFDTGCTLVSVTKGDVVITKPATEVEIVDQAFKLQRDQSLPYTATLTGKVSYVKELYNSQYKNISVVIKVPGRENRALVCYRMKGTDVDKVAVGDTITVTGIIKNYNGTIQFDAGCNMDKRVSGGGTPATQETDPMKIIDIAYALEKGQEMQYDVTLTGRVSSFKETYNETYKSISVMFMVVGREAKPIQLYGLKGDGVQNVAVGDTLTVVGRMKNYNGIIEMQPCTMTKRVSGGGTPPVAEKTPASIMAAAKNLAENEELPYEVTLSGKVTSIDTLYDSEYQNVTATISVTGTSDSLKLYRLKGTGVEKLAVGDTITATGHIKNYNGTIEMVNCIMTARTSGGGTPPVQQTEASKILADAEKLAADAQLPYEVTLSGKVTEINNPYDPDFQNISFTITVDGTGGKTLLCYRVKGDEASKVCANDTVTVVGYIKNYQGTKIELVSGEITKRVSGGGTVQTAPSDPKQIVDAAYALAPGASLPYKATLTGKIVSIDDEYNTQYKNITVTITVAGKEDKPIKCYRLKGTGAESLAVGNTITVSGTIKNYQHSSGDCEIEFDAGCTLVSVTKTMTGIVVLETEKVNAPVEPRAAETNASKILNEAYALAEGESLSYQSTLTGKITSIKDPYNPSFSNISVWMEVTGYADKPILAYRVKGTGAENLLVDDIITVTGTITNYKGTIEFAQGCTLDKVVSGGGTAPVAPEDPKQIVDEAYALAEGTALPYKATLTGKITEIGTYNESYGDLTLKILVEGKEFECYAMRGENLLDLEVGDTITVTGTIKNYYGKIEFDKPTLDAVVKGEGTEPTAIKLYCQAPADWTQCYIYTWDASNAATTGAWPGSLMNDEGNGLWSYEVPAAAANVIFNNGYVQTADLTVPTDDKTMYVFNNRVWELPIASGFGDKTVIAEATVNFATAEAAWDADSHKFVPAADGNVTVDVTACTPGFYVDVYADGEWIDEYYESDPKKIVIAVSEGVTYEFFVCSVEIYLPGMGSPAAGSVTYKITADIAAWEPNPGGVETVVYVNTYPFDYQLPENFQLTPIDVLDNQPDVAVLASDGFYHYGSGDGPLMVTDLTEFPINLYDACLNRQLWAYVYDDNGELIAKYDYNEAMNEYLEAGLVPVTGELATMLQRLGEQHGWWLAGGFVFEDDAPADSTTAWMVSCYCLDIEEDYVPAEMGDVTGDGQLNLGDVAKLYAHIRNTKPLTEAWALANADFNGDGRINIGDTARVYAYIRGKDPNAVVDAAYRLEENQELAQDHTLTGRVLQIIEPYNAKYGCITVMMATAGREDYPILCSRLMGADGANVSTNDKITVTGRLRNFYGTVEFKEGCQLVKWENVPTPEEAMAQIVDEAYALETNQTMDRAVTLTGKVISIDQAYTAGVSYISVTIEVPGREENPISCYRMVGEQISKVRTGDTITVTGTLRNFYGTVEFTEGCHLESYTPGGNTVETDPVRIMAVAKLLEENAELPYDVTLSGRVLSIDTPYDSAYQNITATISVTGTSDSLQLYRLKGTGVEKLAVGDTVTVVGRIKKYNNQLELVYGTMTDRVSGGGSVQTAPTDPKQIVDAAFALGENEALPYFATLTGTVKSIDQSYNEQYKNITLTMTVQGTDGPKDIVCYRLRGDAVANVAVGNTITVTGAIKRFVRDKDGVREDFVEFDTGCILDSLQK